MSQTRHTVSKALEILHRPQVGTDRRRDRAGAEAGGFVVSAMGQMPKPGIAAVPAG